MFVMNESVEFDDDDDDESGSEIGYKLNLVEGA